MDRDGTGQPPGEFDVTCINKKFGAYRALCDVSFSVVSGEILGLIGPNGAGKTTLLECITGLLPVTAGTVSRKGRPLSIDARKAVFWYLPDAILPFSRQRVATTLVFFDKITGAGRDRHDYLVHRLDLTPVLNKSFSALSKGYRRRVLLALALMGRPPVLLLDEPFDGLDLRQTLGVMDLLRDCRAGKTMILSIHQLTEAEKICDRFLLLGQGRLLGIGTLADLRRQTGLSGRAGLEEVFLALT